MRTSSTLVSAVFSFGAVCVSPVTAHHSSTYFDMSVDLVHENVTVVEYEIENPHGILVYSFVNGEGEEELWDAELPSANFSRRGGVVPSLISPGDTVTITGWPGLPTRTRDKFMRLSRVDLADGSYATFTAISATYVPAGEE
jgi:hypothetical protein